MIKIYSAIVLVGLVSSSILRWRGLTTARSTALGALIALVLAAIFTVILVLAGDPPTPGARTITPEELKSTE